MNGKRSNLTFFVIFKRLLCIHSLYLFKTSFGRSWAALGPLLGHLGPLLGALGSLLASLGRSWAALGRLLAALGPLLAALELLKIRKIRKERKCAS